MYLEKRWPKLNSLNVLRENTEIEKSYTMTCYGHIFVRNLW